MIFIAILLIATGLSFTLLFETWPMRIIGAVLCVLGTALLIAYYLRLLAKRKEKYEASLEEKEILLRQEYQQHFEMTMKEELAKKDEKIASMDQRLQLSQPTPPDLHWELPLEERIQSLRSYFENNNNLNQNYRRFFAELERAAKYQTLRKNINDNYTTPMLNELKDEKYTLDEANMHVLLGNLIQLALVGIDYTQEFHTQNKGYDSLAINVAAGTISQEEAAKKAKKASDNIYETVKTIRVLNEMVQKLGLNDRAIIVNDTLLQE